MNRRNRKNKKNVKTNRVLTIIFIMIIAINTYVIAHKIFWKDTLPSFLGLSFLIDDSDAMYPEIKQGDLITTIESETYQSGDIILIYNNEEFEMQRVVDVVEGGYIAEYDSSLDENKHMILSEDVKGKVADVFENGQTIMDCQIIVLFAILLIFEVRRIRKITIVREVENEAEEKLMINENTESNVYRRKIAINKDNVKNTLNDMFGGVKFNHRKLIEVMGLFVIVGSLITLTYARYSSEVTVSSSVQIANFYVDGVYTNYDTIILDDLAPGETRKFTVEIVNYDDTTTSEVSQSYQIMLYTTENLPVQYSIKPVTTTTSSTATYLSEFTESGENTYTAEGGLLKHTTQEKHVYEISVSWDENIDNPSYSKEIDYIQLMINAQQAN